MQGPGFTWVDLLLDQVGETFGFIIAEVKVLEIGKGLSLSTGDLVEIFFHLRCELDVDELAELFDHQGVNGEGREAGYQGVSFLEDVVPVDDLVDDAGVGAGTTDSFLLELLHQAGLGIPGGWPGPVLLAFQFGAGHGIALLNFRQDSLLVGELRSGIVRTLYIRSPEARELDGLAAGLEDGVSIADLEAGVEAALIFHLAGDGSFPDQVVEPEVISFELSFELFGTPELGRWPDGLVGLLGVLDLVLVETGLGGKVFCSVEFRHQSANTRDSLLGQADRVGTHVGDVPVLVQPLGRAHGSLCRHAKLPVSILLQGAGGEGGGRALCIRFAFDLADLPVGGLEPGTQILRVLLIQQSDLALRRGFELAGVAVERFSAGDPLAAELGERGFEALACCSPEGRNQVPIVRDHEGQPGLLPGYDDMHRYALYPAGGSGRADLSPEDG